MGDYSEDWRPGDQRLPPTLYTELLVLESSIISACDGSQDALSVEAHARYEPSSLASALLRSYTVSPSGGLCCQSHLG